MDEIKVGKIVKHISISLDRYANSLLRDRDLSIAQGLVLVWLDAANGVLPIKEIERRSNTAQSTTLGVINRLEAKGFVSTAVKENRKIVTITAEGEQHLDFVHECIKTAEKLLFEGFSKGEYTLFTEMLEKIETNTVQYLNTK